MLRTPPTPGRRAVDGYHRRTVKSSKGEKLVKQTGRKRLEKTCKMPEKAKNREKHAAPVRMVAARKAEEKRECSGGRKTTGRRTSTDIQAAAPNPYDTIGAIASLRAQSLCGHSKFTPESRGRTIKFVLSKLAGPPHLNDGGRHNTS